MAFKRADSESGAPAIARDPQDVVAAITPLGCKPRDLPTPGHALEVTYQRFETPGVALLMEFAAADQAEDFFAAHTEVLRDCADSKQIDVAIDLDTNTQFISERTETVGETPTWTEGISVSNSQVLLVAVAQRDGAAIVEQ